MTFRKIAFYGLSAIAFTTGILSVTGAGAQVADSAARFGALESVHDISLSPDGSRIAYIDNAPGRKRRLYVVGTAEGATPRAILSGSADSNLNWCAWVTNARLACQTFALVDYAGDVIGASSILAVDADGSNLRTLTNQHNDRVLYYDLRGGSVIDWSSSDNGTLLMTRAYVPETDIGTNIVKRLEGLGVDHVNTASGSSRRIENPVRDAVGYYSDGQGRVRIMATQALVGATRQYEATVRYFFRPQQGGNWRPLAQRDVVSDEGFQPAVVDAANNSVYGFTKIDGRKAVVTMPLDGTGTTTTIYAHPEVDVDEIMRVGRNGRFVGVSYATDRRKAVVTDKEIASMTGALSRALGGKQVMLVDASADESRYLVLATSDVDPGVYFLFSPKTKELRPLLMVREQLAGVALSPVKPVTYPAADGAQIPGYLTLPPGRSDAKGLPAIVMPHGGPSARDEWGFDWLAQYFALSGYAVLQPNFRGSSGYGDEWYQNNGFQSWQVALGDVADGGRWMVAQGADATKLSIVGWSYGGYAALQSGVIAPDLFKAIVAIAPVTDLARLKADAAEGGGGRINARYIGSGSHIREGSPSQHADTIKAPVLMFHGTFDQNVDVEQARIMRGALRSKGKSVELVEYPELAHSLTDGAARTDMLRRISAFLPK